MRSYTLATIGTLALCLSFLVSACSSSAQSLQYGADAAEAKVVQVQQDHYNKTQPVPFFDFSLKRQMLIDFYKAANNAVATYTYYINPFPQATAYLICPSVSFPVQGGTQLTNAQRATDNYVGGDGHLTYKTGVLVTIPQAEPDGTYAPSNGQGTIVMCVNEDGTASPVYSEPNVITFPYRLANANETLFARGGKSSISLTTKQNS